MYSAAEMSQLFISSSAFLFVDQFKQALTEVVEVKDLDVQNFNGPLDFSIHAVPFPQRAIQVLL